MLIKKPTHFYKPRGCYHFLINLDKSWAPLGGGGAIGGRLWGRLLGLILQLFNNFSTIFSTSWQGIMLVYDFWYGLPLLVSSIYSHKSGKLWALGHCGKGGGAGGILGAPKWLIIFPKLRFILITGILLALFSNTYYLWNLFLPTYHGVFLSFKVELFRFLGHFYW